MGIFDFIKNAGKNLESNEKPEENLDIIQNKKIGQLPYFIKKL